MDHLTFIDSESPQIWAGSVVFSKKKKKKKIEANGKDKYV